MSTPYVTVIDKKRYSTTTSDLIAEISHEWTGSRLWKTPKNAYWIRCWTCIQGDRDYTEAISTDEALSYWAQGATDHLCSFDIAFPDIVVEDA